jgi:predicted aconitase with swiveling domain
MLRGGFKIMKLTGRKIFKGKVAGEALVTKDSISFYGGVDPETGVVVEKGHELENQSITDKILVFPSGKGSTVGSYVIYQMAKTGKGPKALILQDCEAIVAVGTIISELPCVDQIDVSKIETGMQLEVDGDNATVEIK